MTELLTFLAAWTRASARQIANQLRTADRVRGSDEGMTTAEILIWLGVIIVGVALIATGVLGKLKNKFASVFNNL